MSTYTAKISWKSDSPETFTKNRYSRAHTWSFDGGVEVPASSSPHAVRLPSKITLDPQIVWSGDKVPKDDELTEMHHKAHQECYIANSIRSEVVINGF